MSGFDDFGAFAAGPPPPVDVFAADDPFADIVHAAPTAATSAPPFVGVFAPAPPPPAEAQLLSFSPLLFASGSNASAPSSLAAFALDSPAPLSSSHSSSSGSSSGSSASTRPQFALAPPRGVTAPTLASPPRDSFSGGHVSLGELLSFSPVASFGDSFASSSAAGGTSVFDDDELFSLSTVDMTIELPVAAEPEETTFASRASSSPGSSASGSDAVTTPVGVPSARVDVFALAFPSPETTPLASPAFESTLNALDGGGGVSDATDGLERRTFSSSGVSDSHTGWNDEPVGETETTETRAFSDDRRDVAPTEQTWSDADERLETLESCESPRGERQDAVGAAPSGSGGGASNDEVTPGAGVSISSTTDVFDTFDEVDTLDPIAAVDASAASRSETEEDDDGVREVGADLLGGSDADDGFEDFPTTTTTTTTVAETAISEFGDFATSTTTGDATAADDNGFDDFGDFVQSSSGAVGGGDDDDDFGDFGAFTQSSGNGTGANQDEDGFGAFSAPPPQTVAAPASSPSRGFATSPLSAEVDLDAFFSQAFPVQSTPTPLEAAPFVPSASTRSSFTDLFQDKHGVSDALVTAIYRAAVEGYFQDDASSSAAGARPTSVDQHESELRTLRLKHLKFVLTETIQEAARHDGVFPHGSDQYHALLSLVNSDDEQRMRDALTSTQHALFTSSLNDAMMRFARQAAMSAKAKIAEQAAHQLLSSRGSLLATTRQLLSRSGGGGSSSSATPPGSGGGHDSSDSRPKAASSSRGYGVGGFGSSVDDSHIEPTISGSESSGRRRHSGSSEADFAPSGSRGAGSGSGGLMKKFQDRFSSFSSSRGRTRVVSLRRMGHSGEDVRAMELNMDSISGGLDQVKWKCAVFLYDVDEVAKVAPSQIRILAYPSKEVLAAKSDRAALLKFLKPGAVWTIDIGASNNDVLNAW